MKNIEISTELLKCFVYAGPLSVFICLGTFIKAEACKQWLFTSLTFSSL